MKLNDPQAAQMALLAMYAEDMFERLPKDNKHQIPQEDAQVDAGWNTQWTIVGWMCAQDVLKLEQDVGVGSTLVYYGFLAQSRTDATRFVAVVRGTEQIIEWLKDAEAWLISYDKARPVTGKAEEGFFSIYRTMQYGTWAGGSTPQPTGTTAAAGIAQAVGGNHLTVVGHSLGSPLATYLTLDLVTTRGPDKVAMCAIASPKPGDDTFAKYFASKVTNYQVYNYDEDKVPDLPIRVPLVLPFSPLPQAREFSPDEADANIHDSITCNHHVVCYAAMLDYQAADWSALKQLPRIGGCAKCIQGPNP